MNAIIFITFIAAVLPAIYGQFTGDEATILFKLHCSGDEALKVKAKDCLSKLPLEIQEARADCRAEVVPESNGDLAVYRTHLCAGGGNQDIAEKTVKCGQKLRREKAKTLSDADLRTVLNSLVCLRKLTRE